jgi:hypothetical protein
MLKTFHLVECGLLHAIKILFEAVLNDTLLFFNYLTNGHSFVGSMELILEHRFRYLGLHESAIIVELNLIWILRSEFDI